MQDIVQDAARAVSDCVNRASVNDASELAEALATDHRTLIQIKADVFIRFFRILAEDHTAGRFDARNEAACERAAIMVKALNEAGFDFDGMPFI